MGGRKRNKPVSVDVSPPPFPPQGPSVARPGPGGLPQCRLPGTHTLVLAAAIGIG